MLNNSIGVLITVLPVLLISYKYVRNEYRTLVSWGNLNKLIDVQCKWSTLPKLKEIKRHLNNYLLHITHNNLTFKYRVLTKSYDRKVLTQSNSMINRKERT